MNLKKEQAIKLRLQGKSYLEINRLIHISKSTLSVWLKDLQIPDTAKTAINNRGRKAAIAALIKRNKLQTHLAQQRALNIQDTAAKNIKQLTKQELLIAGIALYWAEGYKRLIIRGGIEKTHHPVSLSNSDPQLIQLFLRFLREICLVPENKISANVRIFEHQNAGQLLQFWHKTTKIPLEKFHKFYYGISKSSLGKRPYNILPYGTIQIVIGDTNLYHTIMGWIKGLANTL